jgi:two-component system sensor histidine kinase SenX3
MNPYDRGVSTTILLVVLSVAVVAAIVLAVRYRRLDRDVEKILRRLDIEPTSKVATRALYRGVRSLERRLDDAEQATSRLRMAAERADVGIVISDASGDVTYANPAARAVMDGRLGDAVAAARIDSLLERVRATGIGEEVELDVYTPTRRVVRLRAVPFADESGGEDGPEGAIGYIMDLSDLRRVEAMRRDFLTNAGHEMKTPLGALSVLAETIADTDDPATRRRLADRLRSEALRMASVVDDILTLADIESIATPFEPVRIGTIVDDAVARVAVLADEVGGQVLVVGEGLESMVNGNEDQLVSAVANLLDNALRHSGSAADRTVEVDVRCDSERVSIAVRDHGIGIAESHIERVFERFYRVDSGRGRAAGGTGLGLAIVNNVARTHGGSVVAESVPAEGSEFTMVLPLNKE